MKKGDKLLILIVLIAAVLLYFIFFGRAEEGAVVKISVDGAVMKELPLDEDGIFDIETENGFNQVKISEGYAEVSSADCPDQICVEHRRIHITGETIVCLPHKMVVEISDTRANAFDAVVE